MIRNKLDIFMIKENIIEILVGLSEFMLERRKKKGREEKPSL